jgi:hypothetical protein
MNRAAEANNAALTGKVMGTSPLAGTIVAGKRISQRLFPLSGFAGGQDLSKPAGKPGLFMNPNSLGVVGSTKTVCQGPGALETAMGGAKSRPERE